MGQGCAPRLIAQVYEVYAPRCPLGVSALPLTYECDCRDHWSRGGPQDPAPPSENRLIATGAGSKLRVISYLSPCLLWGILRPRGVSGPPSRGEFRTRSPSAIIAAPSGISFRKQWPRSVMSPITAKTTDSERFPGQRQFNEVRLNPGGDRPIFADGRGFPFHLPCRGRNTARTA
jgi:hypothetical protein